LPAGTQARADRAHHENLPVIAPFDDAFEKTASNIQKAAARGRKIILLTDEKGACAAGLGTLATLTLRP
jgi:glucosamine--fructose-6-phosphate aminotransferase (isomerizing)